MCHDTDVLVILIALCSICFSEVWMKAEMSKDHNFIVVHMLFLEDNIHENMTEFHALTGCHTTSQFAGIGKKSSWSVFQRNPKCY